MPSPGRSAGDCTARNASTKPGHFSRRSSAASCHSGSVGTRVSACAMAFATWRGHSPPVSGHTGSIAGSSSGLSAGTTWSGCDILRRPLNTSTLPDTSSFAPTGICRSRLNLKNTSSANPVPSVTTTRQGWRGFAGSSMPHHLDLQRRDLARLCLCDRRPMTAVLVPTRAVGTADRSLARRRPPWRSARPPSGRRLSATVSGANSGASRSWSTG